MAKRRSKPADETTATDIEEQPDLFQDAAATEAVSSEPLAAGEEEVASGQPPTANSEPDTSGGDELTEPEVSSQQSVASNATAPSPQPSVLSPETVRPLMTEQVTVRCVVSQAILDGRFMVQGEGRQVAYGIYRQAWQRNPGAFVVKYPGAAAFVRESE